MERERDQTSRSIGESQSEAFKAATHLTGQQAIVYRSLDGMDDIRNQIRKRIGRYRKTPDLIRKEKSDNGRPHFCTEAPLCLLGLRPKPRGERTAAFLHLLVCGQKRGDERSAAFLHLSVCGQNRSPRPSFTSRFLAKTKG